MRPSLAAHFDDTEVVSRRSSPELTTAIDYAVRLGEIGAVLPGVYARADHQAFPEVRVAALQAYEPRAVLVEHAAARFSFWPTLPVDVVAAAVPRVLVRRAGFRWVRRTLPAHLVSEVNGVRLTVPALTALDLGPDAIDLALRTGATTVAQLREALEATPRRPGNRARSLLLEESSDNPWSAAERQFHRMLRQAGIAGWRANVPLTTDGAAYVIDVAFAAQRLAIEIDGRHYHGDATFESDRWRQNALVLDGWRVLRFTWTMIEKYPERVIETVRKGLA